MWMAAAVISIVGAVATAIGASAIALRSLEPIGEGQLLSVDARSAAERLLAADPHDVDNELRHLRNDLAIEAVSVVAPDGTVMKSTASDLNETKVDPLLAGALTQGRFSAVASETPAHIHIDGVIEWQPGDALYHALQPLGDGAGVLLTYDMSELLQRRADATQTPPVVVPLAIGSGVSLLAAGLLIAARGKAARARELMALEFEHHRARAEELEVYNRELEAARVETQRALDLAEEKNRIRSEFVLMINHELRTPLTGVVTAARLLSNSLNIDTEERELLEDVIANGERLEGLLAQMLAVARAENCGLTANPIAQSLSTVIDRVKRAHKGAHTSMTEGLGISPIDVITDATTLAQLVATLVDNAYTHGSRRVEIVVTDSIPRRVHHQIGQRNADAVYVAVVDDGPGIDLEFLPRAFEKFEKRSFSSGTGLGLYMARMMVESIGASLSVITSEKGTVMAIGIPARAEEMVA